MKTALKRLVGVAAASALLVGGFSTAVSASANTPNGKKPNVAINEYKNAKAEFKMTMKVYIDTKTAGMAEYRAALAAFKAANAAYLAAVESVKNQYRTAVKAAWRVAKLVIESPTATSEQKAAARATFDAAKASAAAARDTALAALTPIGTPPVKPTKVENPAGNDEDKPKPTEDPKKKNLNEKKSNS